MQYVFKCIYLYLYLHLWGICIYRGICNHRGKKCTSVRGHKLVAQGNLSPWMWFLLTKEFSKSSLGLNLMI